MVALGRAGGAVLGSARRPPGLARASVSRGGRRPVPSSAGLPSGLPGLHPSRPRSAPAPCFPVSPACVPTSDHALSRQPPAPPSPCVPVLRPLLPAPPWRPPPPGPSSIPVRVRLLSAPPSRVWPPLPASVSVFPLAKSPAPPRTAEAPATSPEDSGGPMGVLRARGRAVGLWVTLPRRSPALQVASSGRHSAARGPRAPPRAPHQATLVPARVETALEIFSFLTSPLPWRA